MTIKEAAQKTGVSQQAIYKRLKQRGVKLDTIRDKETGQLTPEGESLVMELFTIDGSAENPGLNQDSTEVEKLKTEVERLNVQVEKLKTEVEQLQNERDFLRVTLEREQQLHGLTISKLPALPPTAAERGRLHTLWDKIRGRA